MSDSKTTTPDLCSLLATQGFAILPSALSETQLSTLRAAAEELTQRARNGHWPWVRTVGKQFPPWPIQQENETDHDVPIWGVQHLLHPDLPEATRRVFAEVYFGDAIINGVLETLGLDQQGGEDRLVMELFNLLVAPPSDFALRWHRDAVDWSNGMTAEDEMQALGLAPLLSSTKDTQGSGSQSNSNTGRRQHHAQYNMPLYHDTSLHVIPGSHLRARASLEAKLLNGDPFTEELPNVLEVALEPGDVVFYDQNIIHRGVYKAGVPRLTLHGSVGDSNEGRSRARNVLQHGVGEWVSRCSFDCIEDEGLRKRADEMKARLVELGKTTVDTGYCLEG